MDIKIRNLTFSYDESIALENLSVDIYSGEIVALLGPSGCGKTTLLKLIAGLLEVSFGELYFDEENIGQKKTQERNVGMVFQSYALFPHMTVAENIQYGLKIRKEPKELIRSKVDKIIDKTQLKGLNDRKVQEISGGQQQRVALARALVVEPNVMLFDEPLSNLDENLRKSMRREIKRIQRELNITSIYVTHDQEEAMAIADRIVIMNKGKIVQVGKPKDIYNHPQNRFVAEFMGESNYLVENDELFTFRPHHVLVKEDSMRCGELVDSECLGYITRLYIKENEQIVIADINDQNEYGLAKVIGDKICFTVDPSSYTKLEGEN